MIAIVVALLVQQTTGLTQAQFMSGCLASGGDLGWFSAVVGSSPPRGVYWHESATARVTVSFYNEKMLGAAEVRWFNSKGQEVVQPMSIPESLTVVSNRVRYGVNSTNTPTVICTRIR
jgi:hypothetical protein